MTTATLDVDDRIAKKFAKVPTRPLFGDGEAQVTLRNKDCIAGLADHVADDSVHLTVTSIPFEELFTYSGKLEDVGNNGSTINIREGRFALNMRFVIAQLLRVTAPGCNVCIHIQQLLAYKNQHGFIGRRDFRGAMIDVFSDGGFHFKGEFAIQKNPQAMAQRLNLHSLMFITGKRNATDLAPCPNDYVLVFQKPGDIKHPVQALYDEEKSPHGWLTTEEWIRDAHGIWADQLIDGYGIAEIDVLDGARSARESDEEKHVCPLQLEVIRRLVRLYSNPRTIQPDVTVLDPFMGIGSTAAVCIEQDRNAIGFELKESYYANSLRNVERARKEAAKGEQVMQSLFDTA